MICIRFKNPSRYYDSLKIWVQKIFNLPNGMHLLQNIALLTVVYIFHLEMPYI